MKNSSPSLQHFSLLFIALFLLAVTLIYLKSVLLPLVIAIFIYFAVAPATDLLQKKFNINKTLSFLIVGGGLILAVMLVLFLFTQSFNQFVAGASIYQKRLDALAANIQQIASANDIQLDAALVRKSIKEIPVFNFFKQATGNFITFVGQAFLVLILVLFMVTSPNKIETNREFVSNVHLKISKYVNTKFMTSFVTGLLVGILFLILKLELAVLFGILAFLLNFIPSIGSIIATLIPLPVAFLQFGFGVPFWLCLLLPGSIQLAIGNVLEPKLMGKNLDLHPITTIVALLFWGALWGVPGMFLAVPITAVMKIIFEQSSSTKAIANTMAGRI